MTIDAPILLYLIVKNKQEALRIAKTLLNERLIACANILPPVISLYVWEGETREEDETLMLAKTTETAQDAVMRRIAELNGYECPCILALPVAAAYAPFARWVDGQVVCPAQDKD